MPVQRLSRRKFLKATGLTALAAGAAACAGPTPTPAPPAPAAAAPTAQIVEKVVTAPPLPTPVPQVVEKVVTATPPPKQVTLTFYNWASAEEVTRQNVQKIIDQFQADNPGVTIKNVPFAFGDIQNQIIIATTGGNPPDLMQLSSNMPFELAGMSALEPLDGYVTKEYLADNNPANLATGTWQGKLYALPFSITPHAFWYSKALMKQLGLDPAKPPATIDELNAAFKTIKAAGKGEIYGMGLDTTKRQYALVHQWPWMLTFGAQPFTADGKPNWDTPEMADYFAWLREITNQKYNPPGLILKDFRQFSAAGKEVFAWDGPYFKGTLASLNKALLDDKVFFDTWAVTTIPLGKLGKPVTVTDIHQLGMSKACKSKDIGFKFMMTLLGSDLSVTNYYIPLGAIPPLQSQINKYKDKFADQVSQAYINQIIPSAVAMPFAPKFAAASDFMLVGMQRVVSTTDAIPQILKDVQANLKVVYGV